MDIIVVFIAFLLFFVGLEVLDKLFKLDKKDSKERLSYYKFSLCLVILIKVVGLLATYAIQLNR